MTWRRWRRLRLIFPPASAAPPRQSATQCYVAQWLGSCAQSEFAGWISGVARFGIFVRLEGLGADGLVPMRLLGGAPFRYHRDSQTLRAARGGRVLAVGQRVVVRLKETTIVLELCRIEGGRTGAGHASPPRARAATRRK